MTVNFIATAVTAALATMVTMAMPHPTMSLLSAISHEANKPHAQFSAEGFANNHDLKWIIR